MEGNVIKERLRICILFNFSPHWMGGVVYIINLIKTLDFLDDQDKPEIILFYRADLKKYVDEINYHYLKAVEWKFPSFYNGYIKSWLTRKNAFVDRILKLYDPDGLYPLHDFPIKSKTRTKLVSWYADLQHKYYPEFFSWRKVLERNARIRLMLMNTEQLVVSSQAVANDFNKFFTLNNRLKLHIFHFVSVVDNLERLDIRELKVKYSLPEKYFMISNQFHKHKNHKILFKALALLKAKKVYVHFVITGKFPKDSGSPYLKELHNLINENHLHDQISFTGIIPRSDQLVLMKYSQAVIQPSLFEGWSTVIEDARSLQSPVIASNIPANLEQLGPEGTYFDPHDDQNLAEILSDYPDRNQNDFYYVDYKVRIRDAAKAFLNIFSD
jgi:glycosyltransferase involved in cell wall biosynthesis